MNKKNYKVYNVKVFLIQCCFIFFSWIADKFFVFCVFSKKDLKYKLKLCLGNIKRNVITLTYQEKNKIKK